MFIIMSVVWTLTSMVACHIKGGLYTLKIALERFVSMFVKNYFRNVVVACVAVNRDLYVKWLLWEYFQKIEFFQGRNCMW